jgi:hypothetical protein
MLQLQSRLSCISIKALGCLSDDFSLENDFHDDAFSSSHVQLLQLLCGQASMALENAKLLKQLSTTNSYLHQSVLDRTTENEKLQIAMAAAEKAMRIKSEFLAKSVQWKVHRGNDLLVSAAKV